MTHAHAARFIGRRALLQGLAAGLAGVAAGACARREGPYPSRELRLVVHASPGGISDSVSRYIARDLQSAFGVPVICENRVGGAGLVAFSYVQAAKPDGYTIGYAPVDLAIVPHLGYTTMSPADVDPLVMHTRAAAALAVATGAPWKTLDEFVQAAKAKPRGINFGTSGPGTIWQLACVAFAKKIDTEFNYVPFPGSGPSVTALLGGHVDAVIAGVSEIRSQVEAGSVRLLGVMAAARSPILPDAPTFVERGLDLRFQAWGGFMLPKGTPIERRDRLATDIIQVLRGQAFTKFCRDAGLEVAPMGPDEFRKFVTAEYDAFGPIVKAADLGVASS
jgi:tripartite-type tricarboxylate transporter receptor subunit TctC